MNETFYTDLWTTETEFKSYMEAIIIDTTWLESLVPEVKTFGELYNWVQIENPANWKYYYFLDIAWRVFLQNIVPYIAWLSPINDDNLEEIINTHKTQIIKEYVDSEKYTQSIEYFKNIK